MGYSLKLRIILITLFILTVSALTSSMIILININRTKSSIEVNYKLNKINMIEEIIRNQKQELKTELYEYASWDQVYYALENKDAQWLKKNATETLFNDKKSKYDILYIQSKDGSYYEYYGPKDPNTLRKSPFFKNGILEVKNLLENSYKSLRDSGEFLEFSRGLPESPNFSLENSYFVDFEVIDNELYLLGMAPIKFNDKVDVNGYMIRGKKVDKYLFKELFVPYFNLEFISMDFSQDYIENTKITSNYELDLYYPIKTSSNEVLRNLKITFNVASYIKSINELIPIIVKFTGFITTITIILQIIYIYRVVHSLDNIISELDHIASGDYTRKIPMVGSMELNKLICHTHNLGDTIDKKMKETKQASLDLIYVLVRSIETKDVYTKGHSERVSMYAEIIGKYMNYEDMEELKTAAILHDIGKIGLMEQILTKEGKLTPEEYEIVKKHPISGYEILKDIDSLKNIAIIVKQHHERYDGKGYVEGLSGDDIHLGARIIAVADTFDAITSNRSYRKAKSSEEAIKVIIENSGTQFDPMVINAFLECKDKFLKRFNPIQIRLK